MKTKKTISDEFSKRHHPIQTCGCMTSLFYIYVFHTDLSSASRVPYLYGLNRYPPVALRMAGPTVTNSLLRLRTFNNKIIIDWRCGRERICMKTLPHRIILSISVLFVPVGCGPATGGLVDLMEWNNWLTFEAACREDHFRVIRGLGARDSYRSRDSHCTAPAPPVKVQHNLLRCSFAGWQTGTRPRGGAVLGFLGGGMHGEALATALHLDDSWSWYFYQMFLAATKQLYKWYFPSVCLSVRLSVRLSHLFHHVPIIVSSWNFQELLPWSKAMSMQKVKVRGQRSRSQRSTPNLAVSGL